MLVVLVHGNTSDESLKRLRMISRGRYADVYTDRNLVFAAIDLGQHHSTVEDIRSVALR